MQERARMIIEPSKRESQHLLPSHHPRSHHTDNMPQDQIQPAQFTTKDKKRIATRINIAHLTKAARSIPTNADEITLNTCDSLAGRTCFSTRCWGTREVECSWLPGGRQGRDGSCWRSIVRLAGDRRDCDVAFAVVETGLLQGARMGDMGGRWTVLIAINLAFHWIYGTSG